MKNTTLNTIRLSVSLCWICAVASCLTSCDNEPDPAPIPPLHDLFLSIEGTVCDESDRPVADAKIETGHYAESESAIFDNRHAAVSFSDSEGRYKGSISGQEWVGKLWVRCIPEDNDAFECDSVLVDITEEFFDSIEPHLHENKVVEINRTVDFRLKRKAD